MADKQDKYISETDRQTLRLFWDASKQTPKVLLVRLLLYPIGTICLGTLVPLFIGKTLATLGRPGVSSQPYIIGFAVAAVLGFVGNRYGFTAYLKYQAIAMRRLQAQGLEALLKRSMGFHNNTIGGKLVSDAVDFPSGFGMLSNTLVSQMMPFTLTVVTGTLVIFFDSWILGLVILAMTFMVVGTALYESRRRAGVRKRRLVATKNLTGHLADTIMNVQTVKTFAREDTELQTHAGFGSQLLDMRIHDWTRAALNGSNRIAGLVLMQILFVLVIVRLIHNDPSLLGIGIFAFSFTITLSSKLFDINTMTRGMEDGLLMASSMTEILSQEIEILDKPDAQPLAVKKGGIIFDTVSFRYQDENTEQQVFKNLELNIKPGEKIGLVGPSGGGKSTLTRLLLRFEDINEGTISIDGQNIADVTQASLRQAISYVPQEPLLFHRPITDNIAYGKPDATAADILKAAKAAHAADFIQDLPHKYDTVVGERGVKLSGGQRQRIAIARAILKDAPLLILDEATSALDSESEVLIQDALWKLMQDRTAIVIAHRLSTIQKMDRILVLEHGEIVEQGTHKELLKNKGTYARLWAHQSGGFLED
ncbi:MAG TPA: ABC transporter ATP-binding protein [Patescibacteria group bacterium]|nr:ABC transporter ATP-binding protein [Patescibacteria group bacterium]